jgi:group I intron endonuclease
MNKVIYCITSPTNKKYIGQSINFKRRFYAYKNVTNSGSYHIKNSLLKYGVDNHTFEILHELPFDSTQTVLNEYEKFYITQYAECGFKMMNIREGGSTGRHSAETKFKIGVKKIGNKNMAGKTHSEETKAKMKKSQQARLKDKPHFNLGSKRNEESRKKMSDAQKRNGGISAETMKKMIETRKRNNKLKGRLLSDAVKEKISNTLKGRKLPKSVIEKMLKSREGKYKGVNSKMYGKKISESTKAVMADAQKERWAKMNIEQKEQIGAKISISRTGIKMKGHSDESKKNRSIASKGRIHSDETKRKISESNKNKGVSNETRTRMSESAKKRHQK